MALLDLLSNILPLLAILIAASPFILKYAVYRFYTPNFSVSIDAETIETEGESRFKWHELQSVPEKLEDERYQDLETVRQTAVAFQNGKDQELIVERIEYIPPVEWRLREDFRPLFSQDKHTRDGFVKYTDGFMIGPFGFRSEPFPFKPEPQSGELTVRAHLAIPASELHLPEFISDFKLQPVSTSIQIEA